MVSCIRVVIEDAYYYLGVLGKYKVVKVFRKRIIVSKFIKIIVNNVK